MCWKPVHSIRKTTSPATMNYKIYVNKHIDVHAGASSTVCMRKVIGEVDFLFDKRQIIKWRSNLVKIPNPYSLTSSNEGSTVAETVPALPCRGSRFKTMSTRLLSRK